jgi:hypothetical protein
LPSIHARVREIPRRADVNLAPANFHAPPRLSRLRASLQVFAIKPIEYSIQAYSGVGAFITVGPAELISNPLRYGQMLTTTRFHEELLDAPLGLFEIIRFVGDMQHVFTHCRILPIVHLPKYQKLEAGRAI